MKYSRLMPTRTVTRTRIEISLEISQRIFSQY